MQWFARANQGTPLPMGEIGKIVGAGIGKIVGAGIGKIVGAGCMTVMVIEVAVAWSPSTFVAVNSMVTEPPVAAYVRVAAVVSSFVFSTEKDAASAPPSVKPVASSSGSAERVAIFTPVPVPSGMPVVP